MTEKLRPFRPIKPGEILKEELAGRGWTQSDLAEVLGRPIQAVNEIISGKKAIVPATAVELSRALDTSPEFWLNLEAAYRLDLLHHEGGNNDEIARRAKVYSLAPIRELAKRGWISKTSDLDVIEAEVLRLLEIESVEERPTSGLAARESRPCGDYSPAHIAWAHRVRQLARQQRVKPFDRGRFNAHVPKLPRLSAEDDGIEQVVKALADLGVRLVIADHLSQTQIDAAAVWVDAKSPVVALSLRYDRIDYFWFTLMHVLAHIKQDRKHLGQLDENLVGPSAEAREHRLKAERDADDQAHEWLLPKKELDAFVGETKPYFSKAAIGAFADRMGVHPGIVVGRLQYLREIPYTYGVAMVKVRHRLLAAIAQAA